MLGSFSISVNALTGPAMLSLPATFARSGIIPTCATLCFVCVLSALCSIHVANTISKVPENSNFKREIEYSEAFNIFWGRRWFVITQVLFFCCITCLNISSIVDTGQVVDTFLGHWWPFGGSLALKLTSSSAEWVQWDYSLCSDVEIMEGSCVPFKGEEGVLVTAGSLITTVMFFPLAHMDLVENTLWQVVGFIILLIISLQFVVQFSMNGLDFSSASMWGTDWSELFGVVLFNFALVICIPAWLYERDPHVDVPTVIHGSSILSTILYMSIGILGQMAMPNVSDNMLESMLSGAFGLLMQLGASIFAFSLIGLGIPLFSVLTRLNLTSSGMCSHRTANIFAVYFPFTLSWFLYDGTAVVQMLNWGGILFTSMVAFILPLLLAMDVTEKYDAEGSIDVYFGWFTSDRAKRMALRVLFALSVASIAAAVAGSLVWGVS